MNTETSQFSFPKTWNEKTSNNFAVHYLQEVLELKVNMKLSGQ